MYELLYIVPTHFTEKDLPEVAKKINKIIEENGGKIIKEKNLGNKKLAYPIKQVYRGFYILLNLEIDSKQIDKLNKELKLTPEVLRHLITKPIKRTLKKRGERKSSLSEKPSASEKKGLEKDKKIDLKNLGEKIDNLFNI